MKQERKILVIERGVAAKESAKILKEYGFILRSADSYDLYKEAKSFHPDIILVDGSLYSNDRAISNDLKKDEETKDIPILFVSRNAKPLTIRSSATEACYSMMLGDMMLFFEDIRANFLSCVN
jgi:CheY-like chemotaxis protein